MTVFNIIGPVIGILVIVLSLYFPIYLVLFILRRIKAAKIGPGAGPSILSLALYLLIIALAAAGTVPNFLKFAAKSKTSEAKQNLGAIYTCQVAYFGEEETYGGGPDALDLINWAPEGRNLYAYYCGEDMIENKKGSPIKIKPGPDWPYSVRPGTSDTGFTCMALGNIDEDDYLEVWSINDAKALTNVNNDFMINDPPKPPLPFVILAILIPFLMLGLHRDDKRRKQALARFKEEEAKNSGAQVNEGSSKP